MSVRGSQQATFVDDDTVKLQNVELPTLPPELRGTFNLDDWFRVYVNGVYIPEMWGPGEAERLWCYRVEARETQSNMAFREGHREWNEDLFV